MPRTAVTVPPSHHSTSPPLPAQPAKERLMLELLWHFCQASPSLPLNALKSLLFVRDLQTRGVFFLLFLFSHHSIVILRN